jgi:hypothetical protein
LFICKNEEVGERHKGPPRWGNLRVGRGPDRGSDSPQIISYEESAELEFKHGFKKITQVQDSVTEA